MNEEELISFTAKMAQELELVKILAVVIVLMVAAIIFVVMGMIRNNHRDDNRLQGVLKSNMQLNMQLVKALTMGLSRIHDRATRIEQTLHSAYRDIAVLIEHHKINQNHDDSEANTSG